MNKHLVGGRQVLRPSRMKWFFVALIGILFAVTGGWLVVNGEVFQGAFVGLFFAVVAGVGIWQLFAAGSMLELDEEGFRVVHMGRDYGRTPWHGCSEFETVAVGGNRMVVYDRTEDGVLAPASRMLAGHSSALPDTYGMKARDLAELMNAYRRRTIEHRPRAGGDCRPDD